MSTGGIPSAGNVERDDLVHELRAVVRGEVDASRRRRAEYSTDASNYRVVPAVVVFPRDIDDVLAAAEVSRKTGTPLTMRGGGTSVAGNAIGPGIVLDTSRYLNRILDLDPVNRTARVEPGVILADLQTAARPHGLLFGPDPSTQARATLGGMIGNNACGPHAIAYGRTADNVLELEVIDGLGRRFTAGRGLEPVSGLSELVAANLETLRTELGRFGRQVSGYSLEHLLPEHGADLAKALVGTEGSCVIVLGATVNLVKIAPSHVLVALGYPDMAGAADAVPALLAHSPLAVEGLDGRLVDVVRRHKGASAVPELPPGGGWLLVEVGAATPQEARDRAAAIVSDSGTTATMVLPAGPQAAAIWRIREDGAGLAGRTSTNKQAWPGWEDSAVPPERLGKYLRELEALMASYGLHGLPYGHFGDGCVHVRIDVPLETDGSILRSLMTDAARLVALHGGSLSGEHGDGRARGELLPLMYSQRTIDLFAAFKQLLDPQDLLNSGVVVRPRPIDADLRRPQARSLLAGSGFSFARDGQDFTRAVHRCVGVGKCRANTSAAGGFMCPSYLATRDEKDSTRGRARVLQEMANGSLLTKRWRSPEVQEALDLCLSCKACSRDCPAGVDMAQYKSEVTHRKYARRLRPMSHYALGWLPRWARLLSGVPGLAALANAVLQTRPVGRAFLALGGMDTRREVPAFARQSFHAWWRAEGRARGSVPSTSQAPGKPGARDGRRRVLLWADSFSDTMNPGVAQAVVAVLEDAGYEVLVPPRPVCCGLTWISTGQLRGARHRLVDLLEILAPYAANNIPVVGIEPSCTAVLRSDLLDLLPDDARAPLLARFTYTLAELLTAPPPLGPGEAWTVPNLSGVSVIAQPHCHHYSVMGYGADLSLLRSARADITSLAGCCGLAGNFGMEKGHYDISVAVAKQALLPALRAATPGTVLLADGVSCRTQARQLAGVRGMHLAELLHAYRSATGTVALSHPALSTPQILR